MTQIQFRRDTSTNWTTNNPTPASGEPCYETDTGKLKIGNGEQPYNDLAYQEGESYTLPPATADTLGGIKVGTNLSITEDGTLSATSGSDMTDPNLYFFHYGTQYRSTPITNSGMTIIIQKDIPIVTPNGTFSYTNQISFTYNKSYNGYILACKDGDSETYYIVAGVYYGGEQPAANENDSIAWFDNNVWKLISTTGEVTELSTQLVTPIAYVILYNGSIRFVYYTNFYKITSDDINDFQFISVTNNDDLDKYCYPGCWYFTSSTSNSNKPVDNASGYLIVYRGGNGRVLQMFYRSSGTESNQTVFYRLYLDTRGWSPWKQIITDDFNLLLKEEDNSVNATTNLNGGSNNTFNLLKLTSHSADAPQILVDDNYLVAIYANGTNAEISGGYGTGSNGDVATEGFRLQTMYSDGHENGVSQLYLASEHTNRIAVDTQDVEIARRSQGTDQPREYFTNIDSGNIGAYAATSAQGTNADNAVAALNEFKFWKGTSTEYNAIETKDENTLYVITG